LTQTGESSTPSQPSALQGTALGGVLHQVLPGTLSIQAATADPASGPASVLQLPGNLLSSGAANGSAPAATTTGTSGLGSNGLLRPVVHLLGGLGKTPSK